VAGWRHEVNKAQLARLLGDVASGGITPQEATAQLCDPLAHDDLRLDGHRELRTGLPEVVYGEGKSPEQCVRAVHGLLTTAMGAVLVTRADEQQADAVAAHVPGARYDAVARVIVARDALPDGRLDGTVAVAAAGTTDLPVARECTTVLESFGVDAPLFADVGVAGVHRLFAVRRDLEAADVVVVVAGMEGALPTLVGGLVSVPIIALPAPVGYGAALGGFTALFAMLTSCAPGVTVVNVGNGLGAAAAALRIVRSLRRHRDGR